MPGWWRRIVVVGCVLAIWPTGPAAAATYYVDFNAGSDAADGRSAQAPFQHCPGDGAATGTAAATTLQPGDTVLFKGGVRYRGTVVVKWSGVEGSPIVYDGNTAGTFGTGRAIIDGSEPLTGWTQCQSADDCGGNPNWQDIYTSTVPAGIDVFIANMYQGERMLWAAQDPNLADPFYSDDLGTFRSVPRENVTQTSLVDSGYFNQSDPAYWNGAYILLWVNPNVVVTRRILSFAPAEHKVTFSSANVYTDRNTLYSTANHLLRLDVPGELVVDEDAHTIYLWPPEAGDPNGTEITYSVRRVGIDINGKSHVTVQGFRIQKHTAGFSEWGSGTAIRTRSGGSHLVVRDNELCFNRSMEQQGVIRMYGGCANVMIEDNRIWENPRNRGVILTFDDSDFRNNWLRKNGGTAIDFYGCRRSRMVGNTVLDHRGVHANGLTLYLGCEDCFVAYNTVFDGNCALTLQAGTNFTVAYNVLHSALDTYTATDWGTCTGINYYNNVIVNSYGKALAKGSTTTGVVVRNNILDGCGVGSGDHVSHNIYTSLMWNQQPRYGWSLGEGESIVQDKTLIFVDPVGRDYHLKPGSPAIDAGLDLGYTADLAGTPVPQGVAPDIGAYEFVQGTAVTGWSVVARHGAADVTTSVADGYIEPRVQGLRRLRVEFSQPLDPATVGPDAATIVGDASGDVSALIESLTLTGERTMALELSAALPDGERFTVTVTESVRGQDGAAVVGDRDVRLATLAGDADGSGRVGPADILAVRQAAGQAATPDALRLDLDGSAVVTGSDLLEVHHRVGRALP